MGLGAGGDDVALVVRIGPGAPWSMVHFHTVMFGDDEVGWHTWLQMSGCEITAKAWQVQYLISYSQ